MRPVKRHMRYILTTLCGTGLCLLLMGCLGSTPRKRHVAPPPTPAASPLTDASLGWRDIRIVFPNQGPPVWVADVKLSKGDTKTGITTLQGVSCRMYQDGNESLRVTADNGKAALHGKVARITLTGHVVAVDIKHSARLQADSLRWVTNEEIITANRLHLLSRELEQWADNGTVTMDLTQATLTGTLRIESRKN